MLSILLKAFLITFLGQNKKYYMMLYLQLKKNQTIKSALLVFIPKHAAHEKNTETHGRRPTGQQQTNKKSIFCYWYNAFKLVTNCLQIHCQTMVWFQQPVYIEFYLFVPLEQCSGHVFRFFETCRIQKPDMPRAGRIGAHGGVAGRGRAGLFAN